MMDYFVLQQDRRYADVPVLLDVRSQIDVRDIHPMRAGNIPGTVVMHVKSTKETEYPDVLDGQLYLMSDRLRQIVSLYEPRLLFKLIPLIDRVQRKQSNYHLPVFEDADVLSPASEFNLDGSVIKRLVLQRDKLAGRRIFKIKESLKPLIVVRLDVAESLLRRDFEGICLERVAVDEGSVAGAAVRI
ncbi:hypothetical protein [Paenibacillus sp. FJAT-26967]|uniref:hypothetical protein n=1 Tax=Paenibacillus sp. FJAT-26967 TaxID=1729690 RepID=UPI000837AEBD|nr:hypothetical protein [Paenibacillus sp. FJAT-26967]